MPNPEGPALNNAQAASPPIFQDRPLESKNQRAAVSPQRPTSIPGLGRGGFEKQNLARCMYHLQLRMYAFFCLLTNRLFRCKSPTGGPFFGELTAVKRKSTSCPFLGKHAHDIYIYIYTSSIVMSISLMFAGPFHLIVFGRLTTAAAKLSSSILL